MKAEKSLLIMSWSLDGFSEENWVTVKGCGYLKRFFTKIRELLNFAFNPS